MGRVAPGPLAPGRPARTALLAVLGLGVALALGGCPEERPDSRRQARAGRVPPAPAEAPPGQAPAPPTPPAPRAPPEPRPAPAR